MKQFTFTRRSAFWISIVTTIFAVGAIPASIYTSKMISSGEIAPADVYNYKKAIFLFVGGGLLISIIKAYKHRLEKRFFFWAGIAGLIAGIASLSFVLFQSLFIARLLEVVYLFFYLLAVISAWSRFRSLKKDRNNLALSK